MIIIIIGDLWIVIIYSVSLYNISPICYCYYFEINKYVNSHNNCPRMCVTIVNIFVVLP